MDNRALVDIEQIPEAVMVISRDGSIVNANAHAGRLLGYERGKLTSITINALIPEKFRKQHGRLIEDFFADPVAHPMGIGRELPVLTSDGREILVEVFIAPVEDGTHALAVVRDITAAKKTQAELRESEQRFRIGASHTADIIQYVNVEQNNFTWYGDIDGRMGYEPGEFPRTYSGWLQLIHPDDLDRVKAIVERVIENGEKGWNLRYRIRAKDGSYRYWLDRGSVTVYLDGRANEGIGGIVDETEQVLARRELERALAEVEQLKDRLLAESEYLREEIKSGHDFDDTIGNSAPIRAALHKVEHVAKTSSTVLLLGETGTGKELLARAVHARGERSNRPLIKVDCSTLPSGLIESELFGHEKGAFTGAHESKAGRFELAHNGTIFLDEVGELPLDLQSKLLRVLEEGTFQRLGSKQEQKVNVRVIAATNRDLEKEIRAGRFRADLYYRLSIFPIESPPLRERREDIPALVSFFVTKCAAATGKTIHSVSKASMDKLEAYDWPGNIRELRNVIERSVILCEKETLELAGSFGNFEAPSPMSKKLLKQDLKAIERSRILRVLDESDWKIKGDGNAASRLGLAPSTLRSKMKNLHITRPLSPPAS